MVPPAVDPRLGLMPTTLGARPVLKVMLKVVVVAGAPRVGVMMMSNVMSALRASGTRGVRTTRVSLVEEITVPSYAMLLFAKVTDTSCGSVEKP